MGKIKILATRRERTGDFLVSFGSPLASEVWFLESIPQKPEIYKTIETEAQ